MAQTSLAGRLCRAFHQLPLEGGDGRRRVQPLGASLGAIENGVAAVEPERVFEFVEALAGALVAAVLDPAVRLQQDGGAEIAIAVPPIGRAGGRATGAEDALIEPVELVAVFLRLAPFFLRRRAVGLEPGLDGAELEIGRASCRGRV